MCGAGNRGTKTQKKNEKRGLLGNEESGANEPPSIEGSIP